MIMKTKAILLGTAALMFTLTSEKAIAQIGTPYIHDPSTIMECDGKYYTFGTGGGGLISEDGWTWNGGGVRPGGGAAPDAVKIGDRYLVAYSATGGGLGGGHSGKVLTMWNKTLDPNSPDFKYTEPIEVASSAYDEDCDAIDAGLLLDPTDGRLWLSYGTYFGFIRLVELDPATGKRMEGNKEIDIAIDCEATDLIYRDGWYYLLGTHGTCCDGPNSTYNIVVGRSRKVTGPYVDNMGRKMLEGGGKMVIAAAKPARDTSGFSRWPTEWRRCHATLKPISTGVDAVCWAYARFYGRMAGPLPVKYSKRERMRLNPSVEVMPLNLPSILYVWNIPDTASGKKTTRPSYP